MKIFGRKVEETETEFTSILLDSEEVPFTLTKKKGIRNVNFRINPDRGLRITAPYRMSKGDIFNSIYQKKNWILKNLKVIENKRKDPNKILFNGNEYFIKTIQTSGREKVLVSENEIIIYVKSNSNRNKVLEKWFRKLAKERILFFIEKYKSSIGTRLGKVFIKNQKTRWGSCSSKNNLNFNWKLIMAPESVLEYVVIHELCHTVHRNHSKRFWTLVEKFDPNYKENRKWLRDNGYLLNL